MPLKFPDLSRHKQAAFQGGFFVAVTGGFRHTSENKCSLVIPLIFSSTHCRLFSVSESHFTVTGAGASMLLREPNCLRGRDSDLPECPGFIFRAHAAHAFLCLVCQPGITTGVIRKKWGKGPASAFHFPPVPARKRAGSPGESGGVNQTTCSWISMAATSSSSARK